MKRFRYGQNAQSLTAGKFWQGIPLYVMDVAAGETLKGRFTTTIWSDTTKLPVMNRAYFDVYAFYTPYRLVWDGWVDFISKSLELQGTPETVPTNDNAVTRLFEKATTAEPDEAVNALPRRAYNLIWNEHFRLPEQDEVDLDSESLWFSASRLSTFHESLQTELDIPTTPAITSNIDTLRQSFATDRWKRTRQYYGDKYVDYLNALGIKTGWSIQEAPESIGRKAVDMPYRTTYNTVGDPRDVEENFNDLGQPAGQFEGKNVCNIKGAFFPEHGCVWVIGIPKIDTPNLSGSAAPIYFKQTAQDFYTPELETNTRQAWNSRILGSATSGELYAPHYEDYRKAANLVGLSGVADSELFYYKTFNVGAAGPSFYRLPALQNPDSMFNGNLGFGDSFNMMGELRCVKHSPVRPMMSNRGVS